jgi:secreted protein with Ig-like and vWFA domain
MMHYAVDDEYLAQAEYRLILETYGSIKPYSNIVLSEGNHLSLLGQLFDLYQLPFPADPSVGHVVLPNSLLEAAQIGVEAEINNIEMYRYFMTLPIECECP